MTECETSAHLRTVHSVLLGILAEFDRVCDQHDLHYIATHGTLLGAVRDGGFAPGDDDLDVVMPRRDYDKLLELADEGAFEAPYSLQTPENEPLCFFGGYAKLRDGSTSAIERPYRDRPYNQGIWMDIMPLDDCPKDYNAVQRQQRAVRFWQRVLYAKTYGLDMRKFWDADPAHVSVYFIVGKRVSRAFACKRLRAHCMAAKPTGQLTVFAKNYQKFPNALRYDEANIEAATHVPFESTTVPIPHNAEAWLLAHYGEGWKQALPAEDNHPKHDIEIDANVPYEQLLQTAPRAR